MFSIGFWGGTGIEAKGLALRFASAGAAVILGSRSRERAAQAAAVCNAVLGKQQVRGMSNEEMLRDAETVFITVPFERAVEAVQSCRSLLRVNHVLVDVTVPLVFREGHAEYPRGEGESNSELIAHHLPEGVPLVAAFKTLPAAILANLKESLNCDVFVCGDVAEAKRKVMALATAVPTLRPLDAGPLSMARSLERMTVLAAELNRLHKKKGARFRIEGL